MSGQPVAAALWLLCDYQKKNVALRYARIDTDVRLSDERRKIFYNRTDKVAEEFAKHETL